MNTYMDKYHKIIVSVGVLLAAFLLVATLGKLREMRYIGAGVPATNTITVNGEGKIDRAPDTAKISFSVEQESKDVKTAQEAVSAKIDAITKALKTAGVEEKHIKTDAYNSYPQYNYPNQVMCITAPCPQPGVPTIRGYQVSHTVTVAVKDLNNVDKVLGILADQKVSNISGPNFGFEDDKAIAREARDMAIDDAKKEAQKLAKSLGVHLVGIVSFSEGNNGAYPVPMYARDNVAGISAKVESAPSVPVGQQTMQSNVTVVYEIR